VNDAADLGAAIADEYGAVAMATDSHDRYFIDDLSSAGCRIELVVTCLVDEVALEMVQKRSARVRFGGRLVGVCGNSFCDGLDLSAVSGGRRDQLLADLFRITRLQELGPLENRGVIRRVALAALDVRQVSGRYPALLGEGALQDLLLGSELTKMYVG
jgi:hypothetical protein